MPLNRLSPCLTWRAHGDPAVLVIYGGGAIRAWTSDAFFSASACASSLRHVSATCALRFRGRQRVDRRVALHCSATSSVPADWVVPA